MLRLRLWQIIIFGVVVLPITHLYADRPNHFLHHSATTPSFQVDNHLTLKELKRAMKYHGVLVVHKDNNNRWYFIRSGHKVFLFNKKEQKRPAKLASLGKKH